MKISTATVELADCFMSGSARPWLSVEIPLDSLCSLLAVG